jgi:hypothetical protein
MTAKFNEVGVKSFLLKSLPLDEKLNILLETKNINEENIQNSNKNSKPDENLFKEINNCIKSKNIFYYLNF